MCITSVSQHPDFSFSPCTGRAPSLPSQLLGMNGLHYCLSVCKFVKTIWIQCIIFYIHAHTFFSLSQPGGKHKFGASLLEWAVHSGPRSVRSYNEPVDHPDCHHQPPSKQHPGWYGPWNSSKKLKIETKLVSKVTITFTYYMYEPQMMLHHYLFVHVSFDDDTMCFVVFSN